VAGIKKYVAARAARTRARLDQLRANINFDACGTSPSGRHRAGREVLLRWRFRAAGQLPALLPAARPAQRHEFNYRYDDARAARIFVGVALHEGDGPGRKLLGIVAERATRPST